MKYILDFDKTLFDTKRCYETIESERKGGLEYIPEVWYDYKSSDFLYEDVLPWLSSKVKNDLFIVTAVTPRYGLKTWEYQREKIASGKFDQLVSEIILMEGLKGEVVASITNKFASDETIVFVDDRLDQCQSVKDNNPNIECFLMVRDISIEIDNSLLGEIKQINNLSELDSYRTNNKV